MSQDILSQSFYVIQSDIVLQYQVHKNLFVFFDNNDML